MRNSTSAQFTKIAFVVTATILFSFITIFAKAQAVYSTSSGDWSQSWQNNSGFYQATGGPGLYSVGAGTNEGQVNARFLTADGTTGGTQQPLRVGQKLIIRMAAPDGGPRTGIETNGRIGFALRSGTSLFDDGGTGSGFNRYSANALIRVEFQGGQPSSQLVDGNGTTQSGMPGFSSFVSGITYEVEMISDKEFNLQVVGGTRYNIHLMSATGTVKQITIADLGSNKDAVYTLVEVANTPTVSVVANTGETFTVAGVISNNGATPNTLTKTGVGTVILTGINTYTGLTTVSGGTLQLNAASGNTLPAGNNITLASGGVLRVSQDQTLGNLSVPTGCTLTVDAGKTLTITGSFTGGGSIVNNGTIVMAGTSAQSFPGSASTISAMNNLSINNNSATGVTLDASAISVTGTLSFLANGGTKSILTTGSNFVIAAAVSGASDVNGWVNGNLQKNITTSGIKVFEVGDANNYTPASINFSASGFTAGMIRASTRTGISSATGFASLSLTTTQCINRVWSVTKPSGSAFAGSFTGTFTYVAGDLTGSPTVSTLRNGSYNGSMWYYFGTVTAGTLQVTAPGGMIPFATYDIVFASARPVTISNVAVTSKVYDAGTSATLNFGSAIINGIVNGNFVNINSGTAVGTYNNKNVGTGKPVTIANVALSSAGSDANAYVLSAQPSATGDITARPLSITAVANTKIYDANTSAAALPAITAGALQGTDVANFTETYDNKNFGNSKTMTPAGTVTDGNSGNNYSYTFIASTNGSVSQRALAVSAATNTKTYDGNTSAAASPAITTGILQGLDVANFTETYDNKNAGTGKIMTASGTVTDGNSGNNYSYSFVTNNTGVINNIPITNLTAVPGTITCNGGGTTLVVSAGGGDGQLQYSLSGTASFPYQTSATFTGVVAGNYTLTVKDEDNFTAQLANIIIGQPATFTATASHTNLSQCGNLQNGTITITPAGGQAPYTYSWTGESGSNHTPFTAGNTATLTGLNYGYYNVTVTDAGGCGIVTISNIHVEIGYLVYITNSGSSSSACGNTGSIALYGSAGQAPYQWSLTSVTGPFQAGNTFTGLAAGTYTAYVQDANGCTNSKSITVAAAAAIVVSPNVVAASSCSNDGSIQIFRSGGFTPYTYSITSATGPWVTTNLFTGLAAGSYTAYVKDAAGCVGQAAANVTSGAALSLTVSKVNTSSCVNDGSIQVNVTGGVGPYTYSKSGLGGPFVAGNSFTSLPQGNYAMVAKDSKGCTGTTNVTIDVNTISVTSFITAASSCASTNGKIQIFRTGGVGPYTYSIDGGTYQAGNTFSNVAPGTYDLYVKDAKACLGVQSGVLVGPSCPRPTASVTKGQSSVQVLNDVLKAEAYPNPSSTEFTLVLSGNTKDKVSVIVTDIMGRKLYQVEGSNNTQYHFGRNFISGVYMVQVMQGTAKQSIKLVKE